MRLRYVMRLRKWLRYALGASYQHGRQGCGALFEPGRVEGYFNDLRHKANWPGTMAQDVPVVTTDTDPAFHFPIVIFQWGLGNWDLWLQSGRAEDAPARAVLAAARWGVAHLSPEGGWACWTGLVRPTISPYSAMAQGEGVSLLVRAATLADRDLFMGAAVHAAGFMLESGEHGLTRDHGGWRSLEEYPGEAFPAVLNGWAFALFGLYDLGLATGEARWSEAAQSFAADLARALPHYDNGYWTTYDLAGNLASPFYHDLHIAQLRTLSQTFPVLAPTLAGFVARFEAYRARRLNRVRAVLVKAAQKLAQPAVGEMT